MVPDPIPRRCESERSAVHENIVGLEIPVEKPNITAAAVYTSQLFAKPIMNIEMDNNPIPIRSVFRRPMESESPPLNKRTPIVESE